MVGGLPIYYGLRDPRSWLMGKCQLYFLGHVLYSRAIEVSGVGVLGIDSPLLGLLYLSVK
jgi:hypothetical protein